MTDEELQALPKGTILYEQDYAFVHALKYNGEKPWFKDVDGQNVYEFECMTTVKASNLYLNPYQAINAIINADTTTWSITHRALAFFLKANRHNVNFGDLQDEADSIRESLFSFSLPSDVL